MWSSRRTGGIGSRARNGTAASAGGGSAVSGSRPPPLPLQGQERGEGAAAQGAEESSAPEAGRG